MGLQDRDWYKEPRRRGPMGGNEWAVLIILIILALVLFL
jgi:hypothetical protein